MTRTPFTRVAVLLFDRAAMFESSVPLSVFGIDRSSSGAPVFEVLAVAAEPGPLVTTGGVRLAAPHGLDALDRVEVVIVPTWRDPSEPPPEPALAALRAAHAGGATVVGLCLGAFVLAAAGLLDGRRATTHWLHAPTLAAAHPSVTVDPAVLFVDDGDVVTSAGTAAGLDACLHLVRTAFGARAASTIARRMVVPPQRAGGQAQFIETPVPEAGPAGALGAVLADVPVHLADGLDVDGLAAMAHMSRRTFDRRFRALTGTSPQQWLLHQRVVRAQQLLEDTDLPIEQVASAVGFGTAITMRPHFSRFVGVGPRDYRATFRQAASSSE